jgi:serpin B
MKVALSSLIGALLLWTAGCPAQNPPSSADDRAAVVNASNAFAVDLYDRLRTRSGNLFFSPESISTALSMTYAGARGETASEIGKTLHFNLPPDRLHSTEGALLGDLNGAHDGYELRIDSALWAQEGYPFLDAFLELNKRDYGAAVHRVDFKRAPEASRLAINQWVEQKSDQKIDNFLQPGALSPDLKLVLTDTIYFKSHWWTQFIKANTQDGDFNASPIRTVKAPMMHLTGHFNYLKGDAFRALEVPYENNRASLIVILPDNYAGLSDFERSFTAANLVRWLGELRIAQKVMLTLPRFKVSQQFELKDALAAMGMPAAFQQGAADFSGMTGNRKLFLSAVIHRAFIDLNEEGTEAAAVTGSFGVAGMEGLGHEEPPIPFTVDHPFIFLIRDNRTGSILFMGRLTDPTQ